MMLAWLLTTEGRVIRLDPPVLRPVIETGLLSDLVDFDTVAPGVDIWRDLLAATTGKPLNATAMGFIDRLAGDMEGVLPRVCGNVFVASHDENGEPCGIGSQGLEQLRVHFPILLPLPLEDVEKNRYDAVRKKVCSEKLKNPETPPPN